MSDRPTSKNALRRVAFGDVVNLVRERTTDPESDGFERYVGLEHIDPGDLRIRRWGSVSDGTTFTNVFRAGQVLFGKRRAYQRKVAVAEFEGVCSGDIYVLESKDEGLLPELLPFVCQTDRFFAHAIGTSAGSLSPRTNWRSLAEFEFPLPTLEEQRRIAEALLAIEQAGESMRCLEASTASVERALLDSFIFESTATVVELGALLLEPPRNGYSPVESPSPTGHWVLALSALTSTGYRRGQLKAVVRSAAVEASTLTTGDLLISRSNTRELVGLAGIFDEDRSDVSWPDTMMRLRPDRSRLKPAFLEYLLRSSVGRQQIQSFAAGTSASMKKINAEHVKKVRFPVPPLHTQEEMVRRLAQCRKIRHDGESRRRQLAWFKQALFNTAFGGVPPTQL